MAEKTAQTIYIEADPLTVMDVIADIGSYPEWVAEYKETEVLDTDGAGNPKTARLVLDAAVLKSQGIVTTPPPRRPATWQTVSPMDKDKLREVVDALRGAMMQDTLGESMERLLQGQARKAGLSGEIWSGLLGTAKHHLTSFRGGLADPSAVLGMSTGRDRQEARRAYTQLRRWAWTHPDPLKCASTSLELDAAWAAILRS